MARVVHFELMAKNPERAVTFYQNVFGWQIHKWDGPVDYWLITSGDDSTPGINGAIAQSRGEAMTVNTVEVDSVDEVATKVEASGGKIVLPKMSVPGVGWLIYCQDSEGIVFGLMQPDTSAR